MANPEELTFRGEDPDERVLFVLHRHPWRSMGSGLTIVVLLLLLTAIFLWAKASSLTSDAVFIIIPICLYIALRSWFMWANSLYVLTNTRVIVVEQTGWFKRTVRELELQTIMTLTHTITGPAATMLNFGDVLVQSSGASDSDLALVSVFDPYEVQQRIMRAKRAASARRNNWPDNRSSADGLNPDESLKS